MPSSVIWTESEEQLLEQGRLIAATQSSTITQAVELLRSGGVVAFPTETVYGLGADAANPQAVARIFAIKGRPADHPVIVHLSDPCQMVQWAREIPSAAFNLAERFWPGPLTLILRRRQGVSDLVTGGQDTIGLRIPSHPVALALLRSFGGGVAAPSANRFGRISPTTVSHVQQELGSGPDLILEGGECMLGLESTILDLTGKHPAILRPGGISADQLSEALGEEVRLFAKAEKRIRAPGMLNSHYAPCTPLRLVPTAELPEVILLCSAVKTSVAVMTCFGSQSFDSHGCRVIQMPSDPIGYGQKLYAVLRMLDDSDSAIILAEAPPDTTIWMAVNDRLRRAAYSIHTMPTKTVNSRR